MQDVAFYVVMPCHKDWSYTPVRRAANSQGAAGSVTKVWPDWGAALGYAHPLHSLCEGALPDGTP